MWPSTQRQLLNVESGLRGTAYSPVPGLAYGHLSIQSTPTTGILRSFSMTRKNAEDSENAGCASMHDGEGFSRILARKWLGVLIVTYKAYAIHNSDLL